MHIENRRLLAAVQESINGLAAINDTPQAKTFQKAATTAICELLRRENRQQLGEDYIRGLECGKRLLAAMSPAGSVSRVRAGAEQLAALPAQLDPIINVDARYALFERLRAVLAQLIAESGYPRGKGCAIDEAVMALLDWEAGVCRLPPAVQAPERAVVDIQSVLERSTRNRGGNFSEAIVTKCLTLHGGYGKNTTLFEVKDNEGKIWRLVSRAMGDINMLNTPGQDVGKEFYVVSYAFKNGISVAEPLWLENDKETHGLRFSVSKEVAGRNLGSAVAAEPLTSAQVKSLAQELAAIHRLRLDPADDDLRRSAINAADQTRSLTEILREYIQSWVDYWRTLDVGAYPAMETGLNWLQFNLPEVDDVPVLLHGDYALHNIMFEGEEVSGVLDWELPHIGDRAEDISWLMSTIGRHVGQEEFMEYYLAAGGKPVSRFQLEYYKVLGLVKFMLVSIECQLRIRNLPHAGPHYCILGLDFIQHSTSSLEGAIRAAEAARE